MADLVLDDVSASDKTETLDNDQYNEHITIVCAIKLVTQVQGSNLKN